MEQRQPDILNILEDDLDGHPKDQVVKWAIDDIRGHVETFLLT